MDKKLQIKIKEAVESNKEESLKFLSELVKIPSINGSGAQGEEIAQEFLGIKLKEMGLKVDIFEPDPEELKKHPAFEMSRKMAEYGLGFKNRPMVVGVYKGSGGGKSLLFNGHMDVMPSGPKELWEFEPFSGEVKNDLILGRGTADMKGGIVNQTFALKAILDVGIELKGDIILESILDEESSSNGTLSCLLRGYTADAGICTEGTSNMIAPSQAGGIVYSVRVFGTSASVLRDTSGVSAINQIYKIYSALPNLAKMRILKAHHDIISPNSLGIYAGMIEAGTWQNMFPMEARMDGVIRLLPNENTDDVKQEFVDYIRKVAELDPTMSKYPPEVTFYQTWHPAEIAVDHPIVETLKNAYLPVYGHKGTVGPREGGTDSWVLTKYGNTPTVVYGCGSPDKMHVSNESLKIDAFLETTHVLAQTIALWCGVK